MSPIALPSPPQTLTHIPSHTVQKPARSQSLIRPSSSSHPSSSSLSHPSPSSPLLPTQTCAVLHGPRDLRPSPRPVWPPSAGQCQVAVAYTGLCGSDLHYYLHARNGDFAVRAPMVLGHESAGVITAVGPGVNGSASNINASSINGSGVGPAVDASAQPFAVGQRVAIEPGIMCRQCAFCLKGRYNLCKGMRFCSSAKTFPHLDGTLQERINHPSWVLHILPPSLPLAVASLAEPLSVLLHAASRAGLERDFTAAAASLAAPAAPTSSLASPPPSGSASSSSSSAPSTSSSSSQSHGSQPHPHPNGPTSSSSPQSPASPDNAAKSNNAAKSILVFGVGTIGLLACALSKSLGVRRVCAIDIDVRRLDFARDQGWADDVYCLPPPPSKATGGSAGNAVPAKPTVEEALAKSKAIIATALAKFNEEGGEEEGFDVVFECTGAETCIQMGVYASAPGATLMLVGMGASTVSLPLSLAATREVDIQGCFRYAGTWARAVRLLAESGPFDEAPSVPSAPSVNGSSSTSTSTPASSPNGVSSTSSYRNGVHPRPPQKGLGPIHRLITHRVPLAEASRAFEMMARGRDEEGGLVLKVVVEGPEGGMEGV